MPFGSVDVMLSNTDFRSSFFYPASGTDLQPLWRMSHLTRTFIYVTGTLASPDQYIKSLRQKLAEGEHRWPGGLSLDEVAELKKGDIEAGPVVAPPGGFPRNQEADFVRLNAEFARRPSWGLTLRLTRRIGPAVERTLLLHVIAGEGLSTYIALSHGGRFAPTILATIQQGNFEHPQGLMSQALRAWGHGSSTWGRDLQDAPRIWLRGRWGTHAPTHRLGWTKRVQSYPDWDTRLGADPLLLEAPEDDVARVRAWCRRDDPLFGLQDVAVPEDTGSTRLTLRRCRLNDRGVASFALAVTSETIAKQLEPAPGLHTWRDLTGTTHPTLTQALRALSEDPRVADADRIVMTPVGFEDEGAALMQWCRAGDRAREVEVRYLNRLDFIDLRGSAGGLRLP